MGLFTQVLSFNGLARRLPLICKKSSQRTSDSDSRQKKDALMNIRFSNYFMLAVFISLIKFSKTVFAVWNIVQSTIEVFSTKTISVRPCMLSKSIESDFSTLNWIAENEKIRYVLCVTTKQTFTTSKHAIEFTYSDFPWHFKVNRNKLALTNGQRMCKRRQNIDDYC